ncbi:MULTISPECIES: PhnE/PtxC family ABC transporter permease [Clavibacter]|uniref:ABC transporter permease subunit n=2 Tax=Clavibacter TaxID=1573 RepID=A0A399NN06_9MICO|nr:MULTISPECIES: ABC transporter permease subunit [Clavibacter]KDP91349.1 phosphate starvation-inducible protein PhoH [Clavibacter cf. michiganensis LMG 26808]RII95545.1 ABC transporter permease subunit [Clavibacter michiganensis]UKF25423.1 ABC transporter permease subunit [Clavibacter sp. A6099]
MTAVAERPGEAPPGVRPGVDERAPRRRPDRQKALALVVVLAMVAFAIHALTTLDFTWSNVLRSVGNAAKVFSRMDPISFPAPGDLAYLIGLTLGIVVLGTLAAALVSVPVAYASARNTTPAPWLRGLGRTIGVVTRAVPDVLLALAFALAFALGSPLPGILAIGIHSIGMISKLFADAIEQVDEGPQRAIRTTGGTRAQEFWAGVFPQVLPSWIATVLHRFDINLRGSAILGYAGVGGLGYAMKVAFGQFPEGYGRGIGIAIVIFALCVLLEVVSSSIRRSALGVRPAGRGLGDRIVRRLTRDRALPERAGSAGTARAVTVESMQRRPWTPDRVRTVAWSALAVVVIVGGYLMADIDLGQITWEYVFPTFQSFWPPSTGSHTFGEFAEALLVTIQVAFAAALLSVVLALVVGSLAARNVAPSPAVRNAARTVLVVFRGVPELVLAILLIMITGLGNQAGVVALAFGGVGLLGKLIADSFEEVGAGPERALTAVGATRGQRFLAATWPQGLPSLVGNSLYLVDTNIRAATILGIVGGSGIGFHLTNASSVMTLHGQVTTLVAMVFVSVLAVEALAAWLRRVFR